MVTSATDIAEVVRDVVTLLERGLKVDTVILYGSCATGTQHEGSDIDLAIFSPDFDGVAGGRCQERLAELLVRANPWVSPIGYPSSALREPSRTSLLTEIIRTGRVVYQAEAAA